MVNGIIYLVACSASRYESAVEKVKIVSPRSSYDAFSPELDADNNGGHARAWGKVAQLLELVSNGLQGRQKTRVGLRRSSWNTVTGRLKNVNSCTVDR